MQLQVSKSGRPQTRDLGRDLKSEMKRKTKRDTNGIPSGGGSEPFSVAARVRARRDVGDAIFSAAIQPGIEEAERALSD